MTSVAILACLGLPAADETFGCAGRSRSSCGLRSEKWDTGVRLALLLCRIPADTRSPAVFGFAAALLERIPLVGLVFSISNRIGAAMWAHDVRQVSLILAISLTSLASSQLEKRQHAFRAGELKPTKVYQSKTAVIAAQQRASDIPDEVLHGPGGFPSTKGPVKIAGDGSEVGRVKPAPPPLPPREL